MPLHRISTLNGLLEFEFTDPDKTREFLEALVTRIERDANVSLNDKERENLVTDLTNKIIQHHDDKGEAFKGKHLLDPKFKFIQKLTATIGTMGLLNEVEKKLTLTNNKDLDLVKKFKKFAENNTQLEPEKFAEKFTNEFSLDDRKKLNDIAGPVLNQALNKTKILFDENAPQQPPNPEQDIVKANSNKPILSIITDCPSTVGEAVVLSFIGNSPSPRPIETAPNAVDKICDPLINAYTGALNMTQLANIATFADITDDLALYGPPKLTPPIK